MTRSPLKLIVYLLFAAFIIYLAAIYTPLGRLSIFPRVLANSLGSLFSKLEAFNKLSGQITNFRVLAEENNKLKRDNGELLSRLARLDILERENEFLKKALDLEKETGREVSYGHVFNLNLGPNGYNVLLNKGSNDGVSKDDLIMNENKSLVGVVDDVSENVSRILFIFDPKFKITARVLGSHTAGIAKGAYGEGMYFDLIAKEDEIKEGDFLTSTGDDMFPAGLLIGRVAHVEVNESQMFKKVRIVPAATGQRLGSVVILKRNR